MVDPTVDFLTPLAAGGPALEFAVGTGRIAIPLAERGVEVHGIELSEAMVAKLRAKPGGKEMPVALGDMATTRVEGSFAVVYLVFNTIMNLTTQAAQVACFENAAAHLRPGGCFVIEVGVPGLQRLPPGETVQPFEVNDMHLGFDEYDVANQGLVSHHFNLIDGRWERESVPFRYIWPAELDLWRGSPVCGFVIAGQGGRANRLHPRVARTFPFGISRAAEDPDQKSALELKGQQRT